MFERFQKKQGATIEKCERELEVKYTKMLTREFCLGWISTHRPDEGQRASLILNKTQDAGASFASNVYEFRLDVSEPDTLTGNSRSICCCLIYAMDVEPSLKLDLEEGKGACVFVK